MLVAPHGGARGPASPPLRAAKINDLHTVDVVEELAAALDASLIANPLVDRNDLDLNRLSQVTARAPWFLAVIDRLLARILARHHRAEVLFIHGWNLVQPKCDIGIGRKLHSEVEAEVAPDALTVTPAYVRTRLAALRAACARHGIAAAYGERYPAQHPNNLLQLFRRRAEVETAPPRLREWLAAGRVEAVQLELGAPLRWPGPTRRQFVGAVRTAFGSGAEAPERCTPAAPAPLAAPAAVQFYDEPSGIGLVARLDAHGAGIIRGGVLLFLGGRRVAIYTGEDLADAEPCPGGLRFAPCDSGLALGFDGALLATDDGHLYLDTERALAASRLMALRADLVFERARSDYGHVRGTLCIDGRTVSIDALGFSRLAVWEPAAHRGWRSHLTLHAGFGPDRCLHLRHQVPGGTARVAGSTADRPAGPLAISFGGDALTPSRIALNDGAASFTAEPLAQIAAAVRLTENRTGLLSIGIARVACGSTRGFGFYEYGRVVIP